LQFPLEIANNFFGPDTQDLTIQVQLYSPGKTVPSFSGPMTISHKYKNATRRTNKVKQMGTIPHAFVFFQETSNPNIYKVWYQRDMAIVAARYHGWTQGRSNQNRRGRLAIIVSGVIKSPIVRIKKK
jgi:hypothetical protein